MQKALIVDDIDQNLLLLEVLLKGNGFEVQSARNGAEALESARNSPPDVVISDILMPVMDGFTLCREWKSNDRLKDIPFIFFTATYTGTDDEALGLKLGAARYVIKPQDPEVLLDIIREVLATRGSGGQRVSADTYPHEVDLSRAYGEAVSRKLEKKLAHLERVNQKLERQIAARVKAEEELRQSEENYRTLFNCAGDAIFIREPSGKFLEVNDVAAERLGYSRAELLALTPRNFDDPTDSVDVDKRTEVIQRKGSAIFETVHVARDGRRIPTEISARLVRYQGRRVILSIARDITERKRAEEEREKLQEQLQVSQKMEAIGSLAGGVAHDFNNLLSVILSHTGFAIDGEKDGDSDSIKDDLLEVKKAADRAVALTRQLLAFSRKQVLQPIPLSLNQVAVGIEKMLRRILGEDIEFIQSLAPDLGVVWGDPGQIEQVLMNLVVNARDAMPEGGKLTIETSNVKIDEEYAAHHLDTKPGSYVQLAVTDTGYGMDEQTKNRLFEPFFTTKQKGKGTGLGLSTVYGIVKQSGGDICVYSELGHGTTFKIYLPRELNMTATVAKTSTVPMRSTGNETIIVVEDAEALRNVARRSLEEAGYTVLTAADGGEALSICAQHAGDIHLLVTDVVMPRMNGRSLAQKLSKAQPTLKVLYMSGYPDSSIVHHGVLDAEAHFLGKPFTAAELTRKVREVLDSGITDLDDEQVQTVKTDAEITEQKLDRDALRALPQDLLRKLRKAVIAARYDEIVEIVESMRHTQPAVASGLRQLVDGFEYDRVLSLLNG
ncbi:MAG: response regulator [Deltaproteobacteria bacterium]|nr:response regulator [Deltaproteobacteria bacterium]